MITVEKQTAIKSDGESFSAEATLGTLLYLGKQARRAKTQADLIFILVNETHHLAPYRQAALWLPNHGLSALSGVVTPVSTAPYVQWLERWCKANPLDSAPRGWDLQEDAQEEQWRDWTDWMPRWLTAVPLNLTDTSLTPNKTLSTESKTESEISGMLLLFRDTPFNDAELGLLREWSEIWIAFYLAREPHKSFHYSYSHLKNRLAKTNFRARAMFAAAIFFIAIFPVDLSILAQGELVPLDPSIIASPLDGVIQKILVSPNDHVQAGQPLIEFDRISLASKLQVAQQELATAQAEFRQRSQRALLDTESRSMLSVVQSQLEEKEAEYSYLNSLNERGVITAPKGGMVLFDDPNQWVGRPVVTGERIMVVADESQVAMEAWIAPADTVNFPDHAQMTLFLASNPIWPIQAKMRYASSVAQLRPDGLFAYKVRGELTPESLKDKPRVGMKGTVKLHGSTVPLIYRLIRRPWAAFRASVGL